MSTVEAPDRVLAAGGAPTPTGLRSEDLAPLDEDELRLLAEWHAGVAGGTAFAFWPEAIRRMPLEARLRLASDPEVDAAWKAREFQRCQRSLDYFIDSYGSVQPEDGPPIPFNRWPEQREVTATMRRVRKMIVLKARQLGLTWLALHFALWLLVFNPATPRARVLALSKHGGDAKKLTERVRAINEYLPPYLRAVESPLTRGSGSEFEVLGRGKILSLAGSPGAARMETATLVILDEFAHVINGKAPDTWTAVQATIGSRGKLFVISTGNGPPEVKGDGQAFARLWQKAREGAENMAAVFLASSVHPDRDEAWRESERKDYLSDEDFEQEFPETEEQALAGKAGRKVYSPRGINGAVLLGGHVFDPLLKGERPTVEGWEDLEVLPEPIDGVIYTGFDWGEFTGGLVLWPLEGGGLYVPPSEVYAESDEVGEVTKRLVEERLPLLQESGADGLPWPPVYRAYFDSAGVQSQRTFCKTIEATPDYLRRFEAKPGPGGRKRIRGRAEASVSFNRWKDDTKDYLRFLFRRTALGHTRQIIAISPENRTLLRMLRGLELDDAGKIIKGEDHLPDALIAGAAHLARTYHNRLSPKDETPAKAADPRAAAVS